MRKYAYFKHPAAHIFCHVRPGALAVQALQWNLDPDGTEADHSPAQAALVLNSEPE